MSEGTRPSSVWRGQWHLGESSIRTLAMEIPITEQMLRSETVEGHMK